MQEKHFEIHQQIGRGLVLFNDLTAKLCGIKIYKEKNGTVFSYEMTELFDKIHRKQDFIKLCEGSGIVDEASAANLYNTRNDIVHCCTSGIGFELLSELARSGITAETLIRFKYGEDKNKNKDPNKMSIAKIDLECVKEFADICAKYIDLCEQYFNKVQI